MGKKCKKCFYTYNFAHFSNWYSSLCISVCTKVSQNLNLRWYQTGRTSQGRNTAIMIAHVGFCPEIKLEFESCSNRIRIEFESNSNRIRIEFESIFELEFQTRIEFACWFAPELNWNSSRVGIFELESNSNRVRVEFKILPEVISNW